MPVEQVAFESSEEALTNRVIPRAEPRTAFAIADGSQGGLDASLAAERTKSTAKAIIDVYWNS